MIGLFQKKVQAGTVIDDWTTFLKKPWNFQVCHFTFKNCEFQRKKSSSQEILQNYTTLFLWLGNFGKAKNQDPWKFHTIFSWLFDHPEKLHFFFNWPLGFSHAFSFLQYTYLWNLHVLNPLSSLPPPLLCFWVFLE